MFFAVLLKKYQVRLNFWIFVTKILSEIKKLTGFPLRIP